MKTMPFYGFCGQIESSMCRPRARRSFMQFKAPSRDAPVREPSSMSIAVSRDRRAELAANFAL
jgi:hypothetical protein